MNVIIDGIEYKPVDNKAEQEREAFINDVSAILKGKTVKSGVNELYYYGYRKTGSINAG